MRVALKLSVCISIGSFPLSYLAQRFHVGKSIAIMCFLWGFTVLATSERRQAPF